MHRFSRRLAVALLSAVMALSVAVAPVMAAPPSNAACESFEGSPPNEFGGWETAGPNLGYWITRIQADIYVASTRFKPCTGPNAFTGNSAIMQWVALTDDGAGASLNDIVQIGIIMCGTDDGWSGYTDGACDVTPRPQLRYFYAWGNRAGCNGYAEHQPRAIDLGAAGTTDRYETFTVAYLPDTHRVKMYIEGVLKVDISSVRMECYLGNASISNETQASFLAESWDDGDGLGGASGSSILPGHFDEMVVYDYNGIGWQAPNVNTWTGDWVATNSEWGTSVYDSNHIMVRADRP